jgi:quercetin dioxygenase-like cupin family protein
LSETALVCADLNAAIDEWKAQGFRLDVIYPADEPHSATLSRGGDEVRLTTSADADEPSSALPPFMPEFLLTRGGAPAAGRAGMLYRDLIPGRLGGRYIASHITIPGGGPVSDWVHFHRIAFQMIYVRSGWVRVVYEGQGEPFIMSAGDLVLQPPEIRHRVLENSPGLEVVEVTAPALHETFADHELELPNGSLEPNRLFGSQQFLRHVAADTPWTGFHGAEAQETSINEASAGLAEVRTIRPAAPTIDFPPHDGELVFGFVLDGAGQLTFSGIHHLGPGDAFVIPPGEAWRLDNVSDDFRLLQVTTARMG